MIITVALTGSGPMWQKTSFLPIRPAEIAEQALEAWKAGAAVAHIHVRDPKTKGPCPDLEMYREVVERIRDGSDMICQITTGGGGSYGIPLEERMRSLELSPEFVSLNVATMTFGNRVFLNPPESVEKMARIMLERNVKAEIECYDVGHISLAIQLVQKGLFREPLRFGLVLGVTGGIPGTPENLMHMVKCLPPSASWNVIAVGGRIQFPLLTLGMILGGDVRVGMEDNIYLSKGVLARSNAELVAKVARIARELGVEIATPAQARRLLRLGLYGANVM